MRLKIVMRETEHEPRPQRVAGNDDESTEAQENSAGLGRNEGTVRFLFGPKEFYSEERVPSG